MRILLLVSMALVAGMLSGAGGEAAVSTVAGTVNIAAAANGGRIVGFSSEALDENRRPIPEWQIGNLIDGKYVVGNNTPADSYGWSSAASPSDERPEWFVVGFSDPVTGKQDVTRLISRIAIDPTTDDPLIIGRWVQGVTLQVSSTGKDGPWMTVGKFMVVNRSVKQTFDFPPVEARYVRLLITSNHGSDRCVQMGEFEVYEAIVPGEQLNELIIRLENLLTDLKRYRDGQLYKLQQETTAAVTERPVSPGPSAPATTPAAPTPVTPAPAVPGPEPAAALNLGALSLVVPAGWSKAEGTAELEDDVKLVLRGPVIGDAPLIFTVSVEPLEGPVTLPDFARRVATRWPEATFGDLKTVKLGQAEARYLLMVGEGRAYLSYCLVREGRGITLTAVAPASALEEAQQALEPLLASVRLL